jgi:hypothetical protein
MPRGKGERIQWGDESSSTLLETVHVIPTRKEMEEEERLFKERWADMSPMERSRVEHETSRAQKESGNNNNDSKSSHRPVICPRSALKK